MKRREKGLTLIELMVTLAVAIVLLAIGIPAFNAFSARDASAATVNSLVTALQQARVEALSRAHWASVCAAASPDTVESCGVDIDWARNGWILFFEPNVADGSLDLDDRDEFVKRFRKVRPEVTISAEEGMSFVMFDEQGRAWSAEDVTSMVFTVRAHSDSSRTKCVRQTEIVITPVGQIRSEVKPACT